MIALALLLSTALASKDPCLSIVPLAMASIVGADAPNPFITVHGAGDVIPNMDFSSVMVALDRGVPVWGDVALTEKHLVTYCAASIINADGEDKNFKYRLDIMSYEDISTGKVNIYISIPTKELTA